MGFTKEAESPCPRVEGPTSQLATKRSLVPGVFFFQAEDGIRDFCLSRGLGDVYKRQSGVALPTDGRADPAIGNEALAGTGCFSFFFDVALYCTCLLYTSDAADE